MGHAIETETRKSEHLHGQQAESVSGQEAAEIKEWVFVVGSLVASQTYAGFHVIQTISLGLCSGAVLWAEKFLPTENMKRNVSGSLAI